MSNFCNMVNPMHRVSSLEELNAMYGCKLKRPEKLILTDESFWSIEGKEKKIAQYLFTVENVEVCFRFSNSTEDISGIYLGNGSTLFGCSEHDTRKFSGPYLGARWFDNGQYCFYLKNGFKSSIKVLCLLSDSFYPLENSQNKSSNYLVDVKNKKNVFPKTSKQISTVFLSNWVKKICICCNKDLFNQRFTFPMKSLSGNSTIEVTETIWYCRSCKKPYITQEQINRFSQKYSGYFVEASLIKAQTANLEKSIHPSCSNKSARDCQNNITSSSSLTGSNKEKSILQNISSEGLKAKIYLVEEASKINSICPICSGTLHKELVNIPTFENSGNFLHYYARGVLYCSKCWKAFLTQEDVSSLLKYIDDNTNNNYTIRFENASAQGNAKNCEYLYYPTLDKTSAVQVSNKQPARVIKSKQSGLFLNEKSFLAAIGYSTNIATSERRSILNKAVITHGKRQVADHLSFLISTRRAQKNGETKYANAIRIWQEDLIFLTQKSR